MDRQERLKSVRKIIERCADNESSFDTLYSELLEEFQIEYNFDGDMHANNYLNKLRQIRDKQANLYIKRKQENQREAHRTNTMTL